MYFSDEIFLVSEERKQDKLKQFEEIRKEISVWCDLTSVSGSEASSAGQNGHKVEARATIHVEDYNGEKVVHYTGENPLLHKGYYDVYRTYLVGGTIELYLQEKEGVR